MKRRGLFSSMAITPIGMVSAASSAALQDKDNKPPKTEQVSKFTMYKGHFWIYNTKIDDWVLVK